MFQASHLIGSVPVRRLSSRLPIGLRDLRRHRRAGESLTAKSQRRLPVAVDQQAVVADPHETVGHRLHWATDIGTTRRKPGKALNGPSGVPWLDPRARLTPKAFCYEPNRQNQLTQPERCEQRKYDVMAKEWHRDPCDFQQGSD